MRHASFVMHAKQDSTLENFQAFESGETPLSYFGFIDRL